MQQRYRTLQTGPLLLCSNVGAAELERESFFSFQSTLHDKMRLVSMS